MGANIKGKNNPTIKRDRIGDLPIGRGNLNSPKQQNNFKILRA